MYCENMFTGSHWTLASHRIHVITLVVPNSNMLSERSEVHRGVIWAEVSGSFSHPGTGWYYDNPSNHIMLHGSTNGDATAQSHCPFGPVFAKALDEKPPRHPAVMWQGTCYMSHTLTNKYK